MYREKGLNNVCLDGAERLVFDDNEDLLFFLQVDEVTEPGFFGKSVGKEERERHRLSVALLHCLRLLSFHPFYFLVLPAFPLIYLSIQKNGEQ